MANSSLYEPRVDFGAVLPTVFTLGPPKSASTFLWECLVKAFGPENVCDGGVNRWGDDTCKHRFLLPPITANVLHPEPSALKESPFFWWMSDGVGLNRLQEGVTPGVQPLISWRQYGGPELPLKYWNRTNAHEGWSLEHRRGARREAQQQLAAVICQDPPGNSTICEQCTRAVGVCERSRVVRPLPHLRAFEFLHGAPKRDTPNVLSATEHPNVTNITD